MLVCEREDTSEGMVGIDCRCLSSKSVAAFYFSWLPASSEVAFVGEIPEADKLTLIEQQHYTAAASVNERE